VHSSAVRRRSQPADDPEEKLRLLRAFILAAWFNRQVAVDMML